MGERERQYLRILETVTEWDFINPAKELFQSYSCVVDKTFLSVTTHVTTPVLVSYVIWVLKDAKARGIETLLFVARDGLVMYKIAKILSDVWGMGIECRYFYASRYSLRLPLYVIDREYSLAKLCDPESGNCTVSAVLIAAGLNQEQRERVAFELTVDLDKRLCPNDLKKLKAKLKKSKAFADLAQEVATRAYEGTKGYFRQEVPDSPQCFALVDSGWSGSIQTSFGKLYENIHGHAQAKLHGYYFGMLATPQQDTGKYMGYLFSPKKNFSKFNKFCVDLFECLCAANHGRVLGYSLVTDNNRWEPVLDAEIVYPGIVWDAGMQIKLCMEYARKFAECHKKSKPVSLPNIKMVESLLRLFVNKPSKLEANIYGVIPFSRGVIEHDVGTLARKMDANDWRHFSLLHRILGRLIRRVTPPPNPIFWIQGALAMSEASWLRRMDTKLLLTAYWIKMKVFSRPL